MGHSWGVRGADHSSEYHDVGRRPDFTLCDKSDQHRSLLDSDHKVGDRLLPVSSDRLLRSRVETRPTQESKAITRN